MWLDQVWFAGNHSDIGGGYEENEPRLSDISMQGMLDAARSLPNPLQADESVLQRKPRDLGRSMTRPCCGNTGVRRLSPA